MLTFEKFERLVVSAIPQKPVSLQLIGQNGEILTAWLSSLNCLDKHEQYAQFKTVLSELIISPMADEQRFVILEQSHQASERLIALMHADYIHAAQNTSPEYKACIDEVRSLYFLKILAYQGIANRALAVLQTNTPADATEQILKAGDQNKANWLSKLTNNLSGNLVKNGISLERFNEAKRLFALSVFRIMNTYDKLIMEFALVYQKPPNLLWGQMNRWYFISIGQSVDRTDVSKLSASMPSTCIYQQYLQSCIASFANLFAYRRADIVNIFKILPTWVNYVDTTFVADKHLKVFVNLKGNMPPELVGPYASVNPFNENNICLFINFARLFDYLKSIKKPTEKMDIQGAFEYRLAKLVLVAFDRNDAQKDEFSITAGHSASLLVGFNDIYNQIADGKSFNQIIVQSSLPDHYKAKRIPSSIPACPKDVQLLTRSESGTRFIYGNYDDKTVATDNISTRPLLQSFGLFAMKSDLSANKHPWRIGVVCWAEPKDAKVFVDGRFLGRLLTACGVRLSTIDVRGHDFIQGLLVAGDGLNQQTTLVMPKYHFKEGDIIILRIERKETTLRLENNLLSTEEFEQYEIVRLV